MNIKSRTRNLLLAGAMMAVGMFASSGAFAASCAPMAPAPATLALWFVGGGFLDTCDGDSKWTLTGFDAGIGAANLTFTELAGPDLYSLQFDFGPVGGGLKAGDSFSLDYSVELLGGEVFNFVGMDTTCPATTPSCLATKTITDKFGAPITSLFSLNGAPGGPNLLSGTFINVHETFVVGTGGLMTNATNTYDVKPPIETPEPASLALLGIGLLGLGFARRRSAK